MIKTKKKKNQLEIHLNTPQGNAFYLLGVARRLSKEIGKDFNQIGKEMTSGDYQNLVSVFDKHFGDYVILYL